MPLNDIVQISIIANTVTPFRISFGVPLILDFHTRFPELARTYTSLLGMSGDGFVATDPAYMAAQAIFSQNPAVQKIVVGRTTHAPTMVVDLTPIVKDSTEYDVTINGNKYSFTSGVGTSAALIVNGLVTAIGANEPHVTPTNSANTLLLTATAGILFTLAVDRTLLTQQDQTADPNSVADLLAIQVFNDSWYTIHPTCHGAAIVTALAAQVETMKKLLITECADDAILANTEGNLGDVLNDAAYTRTPLMYFKVPSQYPGAAWAGKVLPGDPGSETWKFKTLVGITPDTFTATQITNLNAIDVNYYTTVAGINIAAEGYAAGGEFIDITQGIDAMQADMQTRVFAKLVQNPKVPFTDAGIAVIEAEIRASIQSFINTGFLAASPAPIVTSPLAAQVSSADRANRLLETIQFQANLAGAVHFVKVVGTVSV